MHGKVLVVVKDNGITTYSTVGVEVAVVVDGDNVDLPKDWLNLPVSITHFMPITIGDNSTGPAELSPELVQPARPKYPELGPGGSIVQAVDCAGCGIHHIPEECPKQICKECNHLYGTEHAGDCSFRNPDIDAGHIVGGQTALLKGIQKCFQCNRYHAEGPCPPETQDPVEPRGAIRMLKEEHE